MLYAIILTEGIVQSGSTMNIRRQAGINHSPIEIDDECSELVKKCDLVIFGYILLITFVTFMFVRVNRFHSN